jgi:scyllo-inositol 2-dehydrogenase (NADP+)
MNIDRQELQMFVRKSDELQRVVEKGWSVRYTTELTEDVWYYMRGEEYSEQIDHFVRCIEDRSIPNMSNFASAVEADCVVSMLVNDAYRSTLNKEVPFEVANSKWRSRAILRNLRLAFRA